MRYTEKNAEIPEIISLREPLETILRGLGFSLIEMVISRHRGSVQARLVIFNGAAIGTDDCTKVHRAVFRGWN